MAGLFVFVFAGTAAVSAYSWGMLMDRIHVRWGSLLATFFLAAAMVLLIVADNVAMAVAFAVVFGLSAGGWTVAQTLLFANYFGRGHLGAVRGASQVVSAPVGAAGPLMAGYLQDLHGELRVIVPALPGASCRRRPRPHPRKTPVPPLIALRSAGIRRAVYTRCDL